MKRLNGGTTSPACERRRAALRRTAIASLLIPAVWLGPTHAQILSSPAGSSTPVVGSVGGLPVPPQPFASGARVHLGPNGKPCLTVMGQAVPEIYDATIFSHTVIGKNDCSITLKAQVCYYQSQKCTALSVPPYGQGQAILGIMPAQNQFRFEYREQFDGTMGPTGFGLN
jgi:hypothetical protein